MTWLWHAVPRAKGAVGANPKPGRGESPHHGLCRVRDADIFVLPSIYQGFGMPIVEAFKAGIPVVAFNVASHPRVAGVAGLLAERLPAWAMSRLIGDTATAAGVKGERLQAPGGLFLV